MPIYEYACDKCEHEFEVEQRISDDPVKTCPECRSRKVKRLISRTSFVLKGGGWYSDLYSSAKGDKKGEKSDGDAKGSSDEKGAKKSDAGSGSGPDSSSGSGSGSGSSSGSGDASSKPKAKVKAAAA